MTTMTTSVVEQPSTPTSGAGASAKTTPKHHPTATATASPSPTRLSTTLSGAGAPTPNTRPVPPSPSYKNSPTAKQQQLGARSSPTPTLRDTSTLNGMQDQEGLSHAKVDSAKDVLGSSTINEQQQGQPEQDMPGPDMHQDKGSHPVANDHLEGDTSLPYNSQVNGTDKSKQNSPDSIEAPGQPSPDNSGKSMPSESSGKVEVLNQKENDVTTYERRTPLRTPTRSGKVRRRMSSVISAKKAKTPRTEGGTKFDHEPEVGTVVWARVKGFPWWPGRIVAEDEANEEVMRAKPIKSNNPLLVMFYASFDHQWFTAETLRPYEENMERFGDSKIVRAHKDLADAIDQARDPELAEQKQAEYIERLRQKIERKEAKEARTLQRIMDAEEAAKVRPRRSQTPQVKKSAVPRVDATPPDVTPASRASRSANRRRPSTSVTGATSYYTNERQSHAMAAASLYEDDESYEEMEGVTTSRRSRKRKATTPANKSSAKKQATSSRRSTRNSRAVEDEIMADASDGAELLNDQDMQVADAEPGDAETVRRTKRKTSASDELSAGPKAAVPGRKEKSKRSPHERLLRLRHALQKIIQNPDKDPEASQSINWNKIGDILTQVENFENLDVELLRSTKIAKVMKKIKESEWHMDVNSVPMAKLKIKQRATELLEKWKGDFKVGHESSKQPLKDEEEKSAVSSASVAVSSAVEVQQPQASSTTDVVNQNEEDDKAGEAADASGTPGAVPETKLPAETVGLSETHTSKVITQKNGSDVPETEGAVATTAASATAASAESAEPGVAPQGHAPQEGEAGGKDPADDEGGDMEVDED